MPSFCVHIIGMFRFDYKYYIRHYIRLIYIILDFWINSRDK